MTECKENCMSYTLPLVEVNKPRQVRYMIYNTCSVTEYQPQEEILSRHILLWSGSCMRNTVLK